MSIILESLCKNNRMKVKFNPSSVFLTREPKSSSIKIYGVYPSMRYAPLNSIE